MQIGDDNIVTLTLTTEVYPEVTLGQYKGLEVEKEEVNVTDEQVQAEAGSDGAECRFHRDRGASAKMATPPTLTSRLR